jgi:hypothetical protein
MTFMVFKSPGPDRIHGFDVQYKVVDESQVDGYMAQGWHGSAIAAGEAHVAELAAAAEAEAKAKEDQAATELADASKPPTREELEAMAKKLGIPFRGSTSDRKLRAMIDAAVEAPEVPAAAPAPADPPVIE